MAAAVSRTDAVIPTARQGSGFQPFVLVVYSADRGVVISGYQFSNFARVSIPPDAIWLK